MKAQVLFVFCVIAYVACQSTLPIHPSMFVIPNKEQNKPENLRDESSNSAAPTPTAIPAAALSSAAAPAQIQIQSYKLNIPTSNVRDGFIYTAGAMIFNLIKRLPRAIRNENDNN